ncbi:putative F-box protein [Apostasia shenzhenica]|uniref:Putative F-box protein n=1 Tax=Apostasia shenzhenica TaxID=1088818 RepID=A0A2I0B6E9_9ASPA|nr:putative F-box protein [Apostasia shenzhenica]
MAALHAHSLLSRRTSTTKLLPSRRLVCRASLRAPETLRPITRLEKLMLGEEAATKKNRGPLFFVRKEEDGDRASMAAAKLRAVAEAAADRSEMHAIIGQQRNNWAHFFLHSINSINLTASLMAGFAGGAVPSAGVGEAFKISSAVLFTAAAGLMLVSNKIQPSQLAEEQRNAARLFKQLERSIQTTLNLNRVDEQDVEEAMEKVLALQKAYPLSLLPGMLEKFPEEVKPTVWWPELRRRRSRSNGWSSELKKAMTGVLQVLKTKDEEQYLRLAKLVLNINKTLAVAGPLLAGIAAVGAGLIGNDHGSSPVMVAVVAGALAAVVNTLEHGGQVGMVFELLRNCAGFYRKLEEEIEFNMGEEEEGLREEGEVFEVKMALQLGRSLPELRALASYSSPPCEREEIKEFAGKLF